MVFIYVLARLDLHVAITIPVLNEARVRLREIERILYVFVSSVMLVYQFTRNVCFIKD